MPQHPLDPLSAKEIVECAEICRTYAKEQKLGELRFNTITLRVGPLCDRLALRGTVPTASVHGYLLSLAVMHARPYLSINIICELHLKEMSVVKHG